MEGLAKVSDQFREILKLNEPIKEMCAKFFKNQNSLLLLGRGSQFSTALEGALKIKEISYLHCEAGMSQRQQTILVLEEFRAHHP